MTVKLHLGYVGKTREGRRVKIISTNNSVHAFWGDNTRSYKIAGHCGAEGHDIIGPWVEPAAVSRPVTPAIPATLNTGKYGRVWIGGGYVGVNSTDSQAELEASIETLIVIRDAKVLK